jgi:hypothetical protein
VSRMRWRTSNKRFSQELIRKASEDGVIPTRPERTGGAETRDGTASIPGFAYIVVNR